MHTPRVRRAAASCVGRRSRPGSVRLAAGTGARQPGRPPARSCRRAGQLAARGAGEQELEHADVVPTRRRAGGRGLRIPLPRGPRAARVRGPATPSTASRCLRWKDPDGAHGLRPLDSVDPPAVEAVLAERDLEPGDLWIERAGRGPRVRRRPEATATSERQTAHLPGVGGVPLVSFFQAHTRVF